MKKIDELNLNKNKESKLSYQISAAQRMSEIAKRLREKVDIALGNKNATK